MNTSEQDRTDKAGGRESHRLRGARVSAAGRRLWKVIRERRLARAILIFVALVVVVALFARVMVTDSGTSSGNPGTFTVQRGDLPITVTESGSIKAVNTVDIKSDVEGRTTIISVVDEGTWITPEDVNNGKVLVELDSSQIKEKLTQQEIRFFDAEASFADAKESLDIQKKQNDSDIQAGEMKARFALMDLHKYLGEMIAEKLISSRQGSSVEDIGVLGLLEQPELGGEARQKLRELESDIRMKDEELKQAESTLEWTQKLYEKKYVSLNELEADRLKKERSEIAYEKSKTAKELFIKYEFLKDTEKRFSDYAEAQRELERIKAQARSKLAQAQAKLASRQATFLLQEERLEKLKKQLAACVIKAPAPGQVVYASSTDRWRRQNRPIEVGAEIHEREKIISIPDTSEMEVEIKVHEIWIDKVQVGQPTKITLTAFPEETFTGKVMKKAPLADQQHWLLNPDLKVYLTDVSIDGIYDFIKTGMSAKVEIMIDQLQDVISIPIQAVVNRDGKKVCYVSAPGGRQERQIETGAFNDNFVEVKQGLAEGEKVLLTPPRVIKPGFEGRPRPGRKI